MTGKTNTVFVVHGRNEKLRKAMFDFLRSIGLKPLEWEQAVSLTNNASAYIGEVLETAFNSAQAIVVLLTPDEIAYLRPDLTDNNDPQTLPSTQSRPNVLFEAGMAIGKNENHTVLVEIGNIRPFSDIAGRHVIHLTNDSKNRQAFIQRLQTAGCEVDQSGTDWLNSGDFTPPAEPKNNLPLGRRVPSTQKIPPAVEFDLHYYNLGGTRVDKLQVINRGTETVYDVNLSVPDDAGLKIKGYSDLPIRKIPGFSKSVTIDVLNTGKLGSGSSTSKSFDVELTGTRESGETVKQSVFIDLNQ
ncbi:nucleotide-binding protein [Bifidobacterium sp. ESL0790]|uniref:nucleotide-binding protein n=1 Tax=Bifidobacterium sp. ESL0790 TaxID=2983233 RepID=UPI0023F6C9AE|nr:nucleotide-binding protein [Bifidobacterium sp. ESL0790]WEV71905.1 nucleotide-binding protein [Bifidobacterium sp. ESL0790]